MNYEQKASNKNKLNFLLAVLDASTKHLSNTKPLYYSMYVVRFGTQVLVLNREPATTDITEHLNNFSSDKRFCPDLIIVELYTGKSRNVTKPMGIYTFEYKPIK